MLLIIIILNCLGCGNGVYAFSSSCAKDAYHRPTAGYINLCIQVLAKIKLCINICAKPCSV